jgi:hypothetical protein
MSARNTPPEPPQFGIVMALLKLAASASASFIAPRASDVRPAKYSASAFWSTNLSMSTIIDGDVLKKIDGIEGVWVPEIQIELETD